MSVTLSSMPSIRPVAPADQEAVVNLLTLAFASDPMVRWGYQDPQLYLREMPNLVRAFAGRAFECGTARCLEGHLGAALWLPPGVEPDEQALLGLLQRTVPSQRLAAILDILEQMGRHHPEGPHWYLPLMGVDPLHQNRGYGSMLMQHCLEACDRDGLPAYLESSNPRNITLYQRHGFETVGTIQAGGSPQIVAMLRRPS